MKTTEGSKRARMGGIDKTPEATKTPPTRKRKPNTRQRTLKDVLNTMGNDNSKDKPCKKASVEEQDDVGLTSPIGKKSKLELEVIKTNSDAPEITGPCVMATMPSLKASKTGPSARWGHTLCMVNGEEAILIGGQGDKQHLSRDSVWHLDLVRGEWKSPETCTAATGPKPEHRMGHTAVYDPTVRCIYLFGGSKNLKWFNDVHILDLDEWKWQVVKANGKAPTRAYHSATLYRHELWIFGGVYPQPMSQPDGCSNDIHVFSPMEEGWYSPIVMGEKPAPRSGHSATLLQDQLVMFGGWDAPVCFGDLHILDTIILEWSKPKVNGRPPCSRSWHASCALSGNRVLIHGGYNGNNALDDSFIFNLDTLSWIGIKFDNLIPARTGHASLCVPYKHDNKGKDEVIIFGGGDNEGSFFQDLIVMMVPVKESSSLSEKTVLL